MVGRDARVPSVERGWQARMLLLLQKFRRSETWELMFLLLIKRGKMTCRHFVLLLYYSYLPALIIATFTRWTIIKTKWHLPCWLNCQPLRSCFPFMSAVFFCQIQPIQWDWYGCNVTVLPSIRPFAVFMVNLWRIKHDRGCVEVGTRMLFRDKERFKAFPATHREHGSKRETSFMLATLSQGCTQDWNRGKS